VGKINLWRVLLGGIVAGVVIDIVDILVDGMWLAPQWADAMKVLGHVKVSPNDGKWFLLAGLAAGIATIWIYAAIRPRFGAGAGTAVIAGLTIWIVTMVLPNLNMWINGLFPHRLIMLTCLGGVVEFVAGALAGAAIYKESAT
jgi:hypothetical protein